MKESYFVKRTHINISAVVISMYILLLLILLLFIYRYPQILFGVGLLILLTTILMIFFVKFLNGMGLYIKNDKLYYKSWLVKQINPYDIAGIKVIKSLSSGGRYRGFFELKDSNGNFLYSAIFVNKLKYGMRDQNRGDIMFNSRYKNYIMFSTVYDYKMIDMVVKINPEIKII